MSRISRIQEHLGELDALVLTSDISIRYAADFLIADGAAVIGRDAAWLITDSRYIEAAQAAVTDMQVLCTGRGKSLTALIRECVAACGTVIGAEETRMTYARWNELEAALGTPLHPASFLLAGLRAAKDADEIQLLTAAQRIAEKAFDEVLGIIRPGLTEKQVAAELVYRMYKYGGEANSFDPIVVTGAKTSMPHGVPGDVVIQDGDFVTMDFGTMLGGYCSDMTRTVAVGHATQEMKDVYNIVLEAQLAGIEAAHAGVRGCDIDAAARRIIEDAGYGDFFGHGFGHSLGLEIHEAPNPAPSNAGAMPLGAFTSAEPGIYLPGRFGVRIEDTMWYHEDHAEIITKSPKQLIVL